MVVGCNHFHLKVLRIFCQVDMVLLFLYLFHENFGCSEDDLIGVGDSGTILLEIVECSRSCSAEILCLWSW